MSATISDKQVWMGIVMTVTALVVVMFVAIIVANVVG